MTASPACASTEARLRAVRRLSVFLVPLALLALSAAPAHAQDAPSPEDPYGLTAPATTPSSPAAETAPDTTPDTVPASPQADTSAASAASATPAQPPVPALDTTNVGPVTPATPAPRARITRETTINPMDRNKGAYRNPKKALFMSLIVPGLGQAYVGQSAFTYARAAFYFGTEVTLGLMWYQYTVVKYDRKTKQYRQHADKYWSQQGYEDAAFNASLQVGNAPFGRLNAQRRNYCDAVQERETATGNILHGGCLELTDSSQTAAYVQFTERYRDGVDTTETARALRGADRAGFADPVDFYAMIGDYQEFVGGWNDVMGLGYNDSLISGTSVHRDEYNRMRKQAQDFSRMQAWFIGGIVINHIASAVDAALTARYNNRVLYEGEARWYDRVKVDGGLAFDAGRPRTHMMARLSF